MSEFIFRPPARPVTRVFIHCSASDNPAHDSVAVIRQWHIANGWSDIGYHLFIRKDGSIEPGRSLERMPAAQAGHNRGTIAICLHGLDESRFTAAQIGALQALCAAINDAYLGMVTFHGHREVAAKSCPVIDYRKVLKLDRSGSLGIKVGKAVLKSAMPADTGRFDDAEAHRSGRPVLRLRSKGWAVKQLQRELTALGYHVGRIDGIFGARTRSAVLAFQADNHLIADGVVGNATYEALDDGLARPIAEERANASVAGLAVDGSRIAQASIAQGAAGTVFTAGGALSIIEQSSGSVSRITRSLGTFGDALSALGPWIGGLVIAGGVYVVIQAVRAARARRDDHRTGKTA